ncbi:MAG: DUF1573 domain-containing protein [Chitinophagales bacterium]|nr:DUF1573 domain-containing protein [Chitinophagales bacterium]
MKKIAIALLSVGMFIASCNNASEQKPAGTETTGTPNQTGTSTAPNGMPAAGTNNGNTNPAPSEPATKIEFKEKEYDFGKIKEGDQVEHTFVFTNTGDHNLIISNAQGSCGCTVPYYPKEPIAPGKSGEIKVQFNSKGKTGKQSKTVTLTANTDPVTTVLTINSEVEK